jgi:hypothetical protein
LEKGVTIPVEVVEAMTGSYQGTAAYALALLTLKEEIETHLRRQGIILTLCTVQGAIRILEDDEAAIYNSHQSELAVSKLYRAHERNRAVDKTNLEDIDLQLHERNLGLQSRMLTEIRRTRKEFFLEEHQRRTPGLPG